MPTLLIYLRQPTTSTPELLSSSYEALSQLAQPLPFVLVICLRLSRFYSLLQTSSSRNDALVRSMGSGSCVSNNSNTRTTKTQTRREYHLIKVEAYTGEASTSTGWWDCEYASVEGGIQWNRPSGMHNKSSHFNSTLNSFKWYGTIKVGTPPQSL